MITIILSPSSRRAWIEIDVSRNVFAISIVALLAEGVDRNKTCLEIERNLIVALLAEGVDRNYPLRNNVSLS